MNNRHLIIFSFTAVLLCCLSCKKNFDQPPLASDPGIVANTSIRALKTLHTNGSFEQIRNGVVISGVVVADDRSGNLYKEICIEDSTGGITVKLDRSGLYTDYPVGRKIFIKCDGLWLSDYGHLIQLGMVDKSTPANPQLAGIPATLFNTYLFRGSLGNQVVPRLISLDQLNDSLQSMLIQVQQVQIAAADTAKTYGDTSAAKGNLSLGVTDCAGKKAVIYTSGYATFAGTKAATGSGTLTAIYFVYNSTVEFIVRDTSDLRMTNPRCGSAAATIRSIRTLYTGRDMKLGTYQLGGTVVSDAVNKNVSSGTMVVQDGTAGIFVYPGATVSARMGDSVSLNVSGDSLINYHGSLEIKIPSGGAQPVIVATGRSVVPKSLTVSQLNAAIDSLSGMLVTVAGASVTSGGTYAGSRTLADNTGQIVLYTNAAASFAGTSIPSGPCSWTGYASVFDAVKQLQIRNTSDVSIPSAAPAGNGTGISLDHSPYLINFDNLGSGLPPGVSVKLGSTTTSAGTDGPFAANKALWNASGAGFKNFASAAVLAGSANQGSQDNATNRALGVRQTSSAGYDPGAAFVFQINNTSGKSNFVLDFLLESLDSTAGRTVVWRVDYTAGSNPILFTTVAQNLVTTGSFINIPVNVKFGNVLDDLPGPVWMRIVNLSASTGSGSRPATAIDDVKISWD